jgi:copper(I)-binding protein
MRCRRLVFVCLLSTLTFIPAASEEAGVSVRDAWVRETPPGMTMMAGYMELRNNTSRPQVLVAASSSGFESVMIHRTTSKDGMTGMVHASQVELAPNASLLFAPGGYHLMLMTRNGPRRRSGGHQPGIPRRPCVTGRLRGPQMNDEPSGGWRFLPPISLGTPCSRRLGGSDHRPGRHGRL